MKPNTFTTSNEAFANAKSPAEAQHVGVVVALALLRGYKLLISPHFAGSCRFVPSCSDFAREAVTHYGVVRGTYLAARRLARCHPLGSSGFDPVPIAGQPPFVSASEESENTGLSASHQPLLEGSADCRSLGGGSQAHPR